MITTPEVEPNLPDTSLVRTEMKTYSVQKRCTYTTECPGFMTGDGHVFTSYPPLYSHQCSVCKVKANLRTRYPHLENVPVGDPIT